MAQTADLVAPLSETTRKERRLLLISGTLLLAVLPGGLRPTKIAALGIDFSLDQSSTLVTLLLAIHLFIFVAFLFAARAEGRNWEERYSDARKEIAQQIHEGHLKITEAGLHAGEKMPDAVKLLREILDDSEAHLRPRTIADTRYTLSVAEISARKATDEPEWEEAFKTYPKPGPGSIAQLKPAHVGIYRAVLQNEIDNFYSQVRRARTIRGRLVRYVNREHLRNMHFSLRYMPEPVRELRNATFDVERLRRRAGLSAPERLSLDDIRLRLEELDGTLGFQHDDAERTADRCTQMTLSDTLQGTNDAAWKMHDHLKVIEADIRRSMRRFGDNAFWELTVPIVIGGLAFLIAIAQAYLDRLLPFQ